MSSPSAWRERLADEAVRTAHEREARLRRRAAIYADAVRELGSQQALADELGVSKQAVNKDLRAGQPDERDLLDLVLSLKVGAPYVAAREWEDLPAEERAAPARRALAGWRTVDTVLAHLHRQTLALATVVDDVLMDEDDADVPRVLAERLAERDVPARPEDVTEAEELRACLGRVADQLVGHRRSTLRVVGAWEQRARGGPVPGLYDS